MEQPTPAITRNDVERVIKRDFASNQFEEVLNILNRFDKPENLHPRIQLDILKLADKDISKLKVYLEQALRDYRDIITLAEYPEYGKQWREISSLSQDQIDKIIASDWDQYNNWLSRK